MCVPTKRKFICVALVAAVFCGCKPTTHEGGTSAPLVEHAEAPAPSSEFKIIGLQVASSADANDDVDKYKPVVAQDALHVVLSVTGQIPDTLKSKLIQLENGSEVINLDVPVQTGATEVSFVLDAPGDWSPGHYLLEVSGGKQVAHRELTIQPAQKH